MQAACVCHNSKEPDYYHQFNFDDPASINSISGFQNIELNRQTDKLTQ